MITERAFEYLLLHTILQDYTPLSNRNKSSTIFLADGTPYEIDLEKLKNRLTEIQKEILEKYVINSNSKE